MDESPPRFEVDDTVILHGTFISDAEKRPPSLIGRVERTYHALDSHEPLEDCLIIAYVPIDPAILLHFSTTGRPPKGYLFVQFMHEECGYALLPEGSVLLISRAVALGDTVKQDTGSAMFGTVVDVDSSYILSPICRLNKNPGSDVQELEFVDWTTTVQSPGGRWSIEKLEEWATEAAPSGLVLQKSKTDDLKSAHDFQVGDHVVYRDWAGVVELTDTDVAILLDNQTVVWVERPWELEIIVRNPLDKPLVAWPEGDNDIRRPDVLNAHQNGIFSMTGRHLTRGDAVITNMRNLKEGRWLQGQYDPNCLPQGRVLDIRSRRLDVSWLIPNAFVSSTHEQMPSSSIRPYENLTSFRHPRDLRRTKGLTRYDHNRKPLTATSVSTSDVYYSGDRVRFNSRRPSDIPQIASSDTYGFDLNEYEILLGFHDVTVRWQDGSTTTIKSTRVTPYSLPESDLCPGDLVLSKEGLKMVGLDAEGTSVTSEFNEMSFFEGNHTLVPAKAGIIQSVDAQERLAHVRWYASPNIELGAYGQVLQRAQFGRIGDNVEDVSLYEIMTEPALIRKLRDVIVVPPQTSPKLKVQHNFPAIPAHILAANPPGPTTLSYLRQLTSHVLPALWEIARPFADLVTNVPPRSSPVYDWIGEIVEIGLDGSLTVRLGSLKQCKDVIISQEDVLLIIDEDAEYSDPIDDGMDLDANEEGYNESRSDGSSNDLINDDEFAIDEIIEYEGGERLDNESGEDEWSTDDGTPESSDDSEPLEDISMGGIADTVEEANTQDHTQDHAYMQAVAVTTRIREADASGNDAQIVSSTRSMLTQPAAVTGSRVRLNGDDSSMSNLVPYLSQEIAPSAFEVLEQLPPPDQYNQAEAPTKHTAFLKQIAKEHRILASSLPEGQIYVRTYESRLDLLRCLIVGPADTPYEYCPFVIDLHLGPNFPKEPPKAHFHSWTSGLGRINPNLYEEGKICLSLLGTWSSQNEQEQWNDKATILQVLISLQGLVFVSRPFYNEAGFETYGDEKVYSLESQQYSEKAYVMARGFAKYALLKAPSRLEDVIAWLYLSSRKEADKKTPPGLLVKVISRAKQLMDRSSSLKAAAKLDRVGDVGPLISNPSLLIDGVGDSTDETKTFLRPLSQGALVMLKKTVVALEDLQQQYNSASMEEEEAMDDIS